MYTLKGHAELGWMVRSLITEAVSHTQFLLLWFCFFKETHDLLNNLDTSRNISK